MSKLTEDEIKMKYDITENYKSEVEIPNITIQKGITLIVGSSGSGKTTILKKVFGYNGSAEIPSNKNLLQCFDDIGQAHDLLMAFGLRSIPTWFRTPKEISNGEFHRFECAYNVSKGINVIDEFTSVVDRNTAKSLSVALRNSVNNKIIGDLIVASCHRDIIPWLQPDWIYDTDYNTYSRGDLRRPKIKLQIAGSSYENWVRFKKHHYLDSTLSKSCHYYCAKINNEEVAFLAVIHGTCRDIKSYWRESRLVVLPEFQGLGIGYILSEEIAKEYIKRGLRYFAKTSHPALGEKRNRSEKWRNTSTNMVKRTSYLDKSGNPRESKGYGKTKESIMRDFKRVCYSHEYIGE